MRNKRGSYYKVMRKYYELNDSAWQRVRKRINQPAKTPLSLQCFHTDLPEHQKGDSQSAWLPISSFLDLHMPLTIAPIYVRIPH